MTENLIFPRRKECEASEEQGRGWGGRERNARRVSVPIGINWGANDPLKKKRETLVPSWRGAKRANLRATVRRAFTVAKSETWPSHVFLCCCQHHYVVCSNNNFKNCI